MFPRSSSFCRSLAVAVALLLTGLPSLAAAEPPAAPVAAVPGATPIADSAARAALMQRYGRGRRGGSDAAKWTGFGLLAAGAGLVAVGAVLDDTDCFETDISGGDCRNARRAAFLAGGIMAGVGVGMLVIASHDDDDDRGRRGRGRGRGRGRYTEVGLQGGRAVVQERIVF